MCKTYTRYYDCDHIYQVQTRLCKKREHEIGAEILTPRSCPNYTNSKARISREASEVKRQKVGECQMCKLEKASRSSGLTAECPPMKYLNMVLMAEQEGSCTAHYETGYELVAGKNDLKGAYIAPAAVPGQREPLHYNSCHVTMPYEVTCWAIWAYVKEREALFKAYSAFITIWFDLQLTPCETNVIKTLYIDMSTIDDSDGICNGAQTAAIALAITRKAPTIFVARQSSESPERKFHFFGPGTVFNDPNIADSEVPAAWKEVVVDWGRKLNRPKTFVPKEEIDRLETFAARKKAAMNADVVGTGPARNAGAGNLSSPRNAAAKIKEEDKKEAKPKVPPEAEAVPGPNHPLTE